MNRSGFSLLTLALLLGGCASRPGWPQPERAAQLAAGTGDAVQFQSDAAAVDGPALDGPSGVLLTRAEAVRQCLATHPGIQATLARVHLASAQAHQARLLPNPVLRVAMRFPEAGGDPVIEAGLSAELLSLLQKPGRVRAADARLRAASAEAVSKVLDVLAEVQSRYAAAQAFDALLPVLRERAKLLARLRDIAESRLRAGEGIRLDVTTLRAQEVELEVEIAERLLEQREARLELARLIGRPSDAAAWALEPGPASPRASMAEAGEEAWVGVALEHRPEIQARVWELAALGVEVRLAQWAILDGAEAGLDSEHDGRWSVGPETALPLPLFDWGQASRDAARARRAEAAHELTQARRTVVEEVRRALTAYESSRHTAARASEAWLPLLEQRQREAEAVYRAGHSDVIPVILATQDLHAGRARLIESQRRAAEALIRLHRAAGGAGHAPATASTSQPANQPATFPSTRPFTPDPR